MNTYTPKKGDIGLISVKGAVGLLIRLGQWFNGNGFQNYQHAFMYLGDGQIIEAHPGGASIAPLSKYDPEKIYWCSNLSADLTDADREEIVKVARTLTGIPYSFLDYFALAAKRLHIPAPHLDAYIRATGHMICSQLVAYARYAAGRPIYPDWTGWVTPLMLLELDKAHVKVH